MRVVLYTGKGGVGKTTTAAATAVRAAELGHRTLVLSADPAHSLGDVLDRPLGGAAVSVGERLSALEIDARLEMERHWGSIREYLISLFRHQGIEEVVAEELALLPGAEELTTLAAVDAYAASGDFDLIVVDCAPTDSTLRLVTLPDVAHGAIRVLLRVQRVIASVVTPLAANVVPVPLPGSAVFRDAEQLLYRTLKRLRARLTDDGTSVRMVVTPERMVIDEARRAFTELSLFDLRCDAVVMNRLLPGSATREDFFRDWGRIQRERVDEVRALFAPLTVFEAPLQDDEVIGLERLSLHGATLFGDVDPFARLPMSARVRFQRAAQGYRVRIPLPGARADELAVAVIDDELVVRAGSRRRALKLPPRIAACALGGARMDAGDLVVAFEAGASRTVR